MFSALHAHHTGIVKMKALSAVTFGGPIGAEINV